MEWRTTGSAFRISFQTDWQNDSSLPRSGFFGCHATLPQKNFFWGSVGDIHKTAARETDRGRFTLETDNPSSKSAKIERKTDG